MSNSPLSIRARKKIKAQMEKDAREQHVAKFNRRMELAKLGVDALKRKDIKTALAHYYAYLEHLKRFKGDVELTPQAFDVKKDSAEMLMLTGVFWDLAKIFDRFGSKERGKLKYFLDKFVLFSKNTSYQKLSQEMLRKFLTNETPNNRSDFKEAYVKLGGGKCFIATSVEEHCEESTLIILKRFRDEVLVKNFFGRGFTRLYYRIGPMIAISLIRSPESRQKKVARMLGRIASAISSRFFPGGK